MSDEKLAAIIIIVMLLVAMVVAIFAIPEPTGNSSVYDAYVEEMRQHGRKPNGEFIN